MIVIGIVVIFVLLTLGCVAILSMPSSSPTATPTVKATVAATAAATETPTAAATETPKATTSPTLSSFYGILVEHPASASTDDLTSKINQEEKSFSTPVTPFHRATIDGRDVYIGTSENDKGTVVKMYIFPLGSYNEARTAQAAYVKQLQAKGFTISNEDTTNSKEQSIINTDNGVQSANVQALGFKTDSGTAAMTIYIPQGKGSAA
jgi:hypothetical protein